MQIIKQTIITIIICAAVVAGVSLVSAWTGPPYGGVCSDPPCPPGGNAPAPINVSSISQNFSGNKTLNLPGAANNLIIGNGSLGVSNNLSVGGIASVGGFRMASGAVSGRVLTSDESGIASWQPGGGASGVSQIIAGTNITISPAGGTGAVTINSTGGASLWTQSGNWLSSTPASIYGLELTGPSSRKLYIGSRVDPTTIGFLPGIGMGDGGSGWLVGGANNTSNVAWIVYDNEGFPGKLRAGKICLGSGYDFSGGQTCFGANDIVFPGTLRGIAMWNADCNTGGISTLYSYTVPFNSSGNCPSGYTRKGTGFRKETSGACYQIYTCVKNDYNTAN